jgi:uncharacterized phage infection (PIP) family protein YhgE
MKGTVSFSLLPSLTLAAGLVVLGGCASGNYKKGASTAAGLSQSADKITAGKARIDSTLMALNSLVKSPQGDLVPKFKQFNDAVTALQSAAKNVSASVKDMRDKGNEYFKNWDEQLAQISNEDIKKRSTERKGKVQKEFIDVNNSYTQFENALNPFMSHLKDIQTALRTDLTVGGVSVVQNAANDANHEAKPLKKSLDELVKQFRELSTTMATTGPPPEAATQTK